MNIKELKANQKYQEVLDKYKKTEDKLIALREKKRKMAISIHNKFHESTMVLKAGN